MVLEDYDIFYFDSSDLPWEAQDAVIPAGQELFDGVPAEVEGGPPRARLELGRRDAVGEAELSGDAGFAEQGVVVLNPARPQILAVPSSTTTGPAASRKCVNQAKGRSSRSTSPPMTAGSADQG